MKHLLLLCGVFACAHAGVTTYTSRAAWTAAVSNPTTINFGTAAPPPVGTYQSYPSPAGLTLSGVNFASTNTSGGVVYVDDQNYCCATYRRGFDQLVSSYTGAGITVTLPSGISAFGFDLFAVVSGNGLGTDQDVVNVTVAGQTYAIDTPAAPATTFIGFVSTTPISSFTIIPQQTNGLTEANVINFAFSPGAPCVSSLTVSGQSAVTASFPAAGGTGSIAVGAPSGCSWIATPGAGFVTLTSGSSGTGPGTIDYTVAPNTHSALTTTITAGNVIFTVDESGVATAVIPFNGVGNPGVFRQGQWWLDVNGDHEWTQGTDTVFVYGEAGDIPIVGDWTNTDQTRIGIFRGGQWWLDINDDHQWTAGVDTVFTYGQPGDIPIVGDWTNSGVQRIGIFRNGQWWLDINNDHQWTAGADTVFTYGEAGDVPVIGDWTNSGVQRIGIFRNGQWWLDINNDHQWTAGADTVFTYGEAGDVPLLGDWTKTGVQRIGIFRYGQWWLDINNDHAWTPQADIVYTFGQTGDAPVPGK